MHGIPVDPDLAYRALAHAIDPRWTAGQRFTVAYELSGEGGGRWAYRVDDGSLELASDADGNGGAAEDAEATVRMSIETWRAVLSGEMTPGPGDAGPPRDRRGPDEPGHPDGALDRPRRRHRRPRARAREAPARDPGRATPAPGARSVNGDARPKAKGMGDPAHSAERKRDVRRPAQLRAALRALGAQQLARPRARLLGRPRALARLADRGPDAHGLLDGQLLRRRGARHRRPRAVPARRAERRGRGLPRDPARRRDAPRGLLRPLRPRR